MNHLSRPFATAALLIGLLFVSRQPTAEAARRPRYEGQGNRYCTALRYQSPPNMMGVPGGTKAVGNSRVPYMKPQVHDYLEKLYASKKCPGFKVQSTYRDCNTNTGVRGVSKSRHLCGAAADTSGCPGAGSKEVARQICNSQPGMQFIDEGPSRYPHCQMKAMCESIVNAGRR